MISFDEFLSTNISEIKTPSYLRQVKIIDAPPGELTPSIYGEILYNSPCIVIGIARRYGDIIQSFTIEGKDITKVELEIGGQIVWKSWYLNANLINVQPFFNGIIQLSMGFHETHLKIYSTKCYNVYIYYKLLNNHLRKTVALGNFNSPHLFYKNKKLYKSVRYFNEMLYLREEGV